MSLYVCMTANIWCRQCAEREKVRHANTQPHTLTLTHTPFVVVLNSKNWFCGIECVILCVESTQYTRASGCGWYGQRSKCALTRVLCWTLTFVRISFSCSFFVVFFFSRAFVPSFGGWGGMGKSKSMAYWVCGLCYPRPKIEFFKFENDSTAFPYRILYMVVSAVANSRAQHLLASST